MISEKALRQWQGQHGAVEERERARIREEIEAEVDAVLGDSCRRAEAEQGVAQFRHAFRHRDQLRAAGQPQPALTSGQGTERRAVIRAQVEREVRAFEASRRH